MKPDSVLAGGLPIPWLRTPSKRARLTIHAYFDDSATLGSRGLMLLAGLATTDTKWDAFSDEWRERLRTHSMSRLHTSDFLSGGGEYRDPDLSYERRVEILRDDFLFLIRKYINLILAVGVDAPAFKIVFPEIKSTAMVFLCHRVIRRTLDHVKTWEHGLPMVLVFDQSPQSLAFHSAMLDLKHKRKEVRDSVGGFSFVDNRVAAQVQAADLLACLTAREFRRGDKAWRGTPYIDLFYTVDVPRKQIPFVSEHWDETELRSARFREAAR